MLTIMGIKAMDNKWNINGISGTVVKTMASEPRRISKLEIVISMPPGHRIDTKSQKILETVALHCPVSKSLHQDIIQDVKFNW